MSVDWMLEVGPAELADVLLVAVMVWGGLVWLRRTRARLAVPALVIVAAVYLVAGRLGLQLTAGILQGFFAVFVLILIVVFQEDLRRLFERISAWGLRRRVSAPPTATADTIARAAARMAETRTGALLVFPGSEPIERHTEGGIALQGRISEPLLLSLFDSSSPGHDGAAIVEGDRITRFAVHLPLSADQAQLGPGGTRHAAALGLAELTDALCLVVSEERGTVSIARDGRLRALPDAASVSGELSRFSARLRPASTPSGRLQLLRGTWREAIAGVAIAVTLWGLLVPGSTEIEAMRPAVIKVENLPKGFAVESIDPDKVELVLRGRRRDILLAEANALRVRVDALLVQLGRRTFDLSLDQVEVPEGLEVLAIEPDRIKLSVVQTDAPPAQAAAPAEPPAPEPAAPPAPVAAPNG